MSIKLSALNQVINPYFPILFVHPDLLGKAPETLATQEEELLFAAHIKFSSSKPGLLVASNKRVRFYHFKDSLMKRAIKFGLDELKGELIGQIPLVSDIMAVQGKLSEWNQHYKDANKDMNVEMRMEMERLEEMITRSSKALMDNEEGWSEQSGFDYQSFALALKKMELSGEEIYMTWDTNQMDHIPGGLSWSTPKLYSDFAMSGLWFLALHLRPLLEKHDFVLYRNDKGLVIEQRARAKDLEC